MNVAVNLVQTGLYKYIRHPVYMAILFVQGGIVLLLFDWLIGLGFCLCAVALHALTKEEEKGLLQQFGTQYEEYLNRTGRLFPKLN